MKFRTGLRDSEVALGAVDVALRRAAGAGDRPECSHVDERTGASRWAAETPLVAASHARPARRHIN